MKNQLLYVILCSLLVIGLSSCKKKEEPTELELLPSITQTGQNTFGCLLNGDAAFTSLYMSQLSSSGVDFYLSPDSNLTISAITKNSGKRIDFRIELDYQGLLAKSHNSSNFLSLIFTANLNPDGSGGPNDFYSYKNGTPFMINITKFTGNQNTGGLNSDILSGTFDIKLTNLLNDTLKITNGRFDVKKQ